MHVAQKLVPFLSGMRGFRPHVLLLDPLIVLLTHASRCGHVGHVTLSRCRGVVDNIRGAKETIVSKPKEFAHLIKNRFGSADNINDISECVRV